MNALTLSWEMSTSQGSVALIGEGIHESRRFLAGRGHDSDAFSAISHLFKLAPLAQLRRILIGSGPGSYSSSRMAIAAAQSIALAAQHAGAAQCDVLAIPSFLALPSVRNHPHCQILGDARRDTWWHIDVKNGSYGEPILEPSGSEFFTNLTDSACWVTMASDRPSPFPSRVSVEIPDATLLYQAWQSSPAAQQDLWLHTPPQPFYLRAPFISRAKYPFP